MTWPRFAVAAFAAACSMGPPSPSPIGNAGSASPPHELVASIERTMCYGTCPIYKLSVYRDGAVEYRGGDYVKMLGVHASRVTPEQIAALDLLFEQEHYFDLADSYMQQDATDAANVITSHHRGKRTKRIEHYQGDLTAPKALDRVEQGIDRIVHVEQLIGTPREREHLGRERLDPLPLP